MTEPAADSAASPPTNALEVTGPVAASTRAAATAMLMPRGLVVAIVVLAAAGLVSSFLLWQKLSNIQEQLARQSRDAGTNAVEARTLAKQAQELARETSARQAVAETKLSEVALQRAQVEELVQSMSRSRDENMLVDIESALRLSQQQAQATGSAEPLVAALRAADQRLERAGQPRLSRVRAAVARDIDRIRASPATDVQAMLARLDELARQADDIPLANAVPPAPPAPAAAKKQQLPAPLQWWERIVDDIRNEARGLVRVSRVDQPEAVLLAPEQAFFLRENLKLRLLNARLALLSRQPDAARADVTAASAALNKYFDPGSRRTQAAMAQLQQLQSQLRIVELPRIDETLAVIATAAAGR